MNLKLGYVIKQLRTQRGVTQEQLGDILGVSYQAVSKWENCTTLPDITLLPEIAVYFGVDIDTLFSIDNSDKLKRIDRVINGHEAYSPENMEYIRATLTKMLDEDPKNVDLLKRMVDLYRYIGQDAVKKKKRYKKRINKISPFDRYGHTSKREYWRLHEEIDEYETFMGEYPDWQQGWVYYAENCINGHRLDKAEKAIKHGLALGKNSYLTALLGDVEHIRGNVETAVKLWDTAAAEECEHADTIEYIAEKYASLGMFDKSISLWKTAYEQNQNILSPLYSLTFLYADLNRYAEAIEQWEEIIKRLKEDFGHEDNSEALSWPKDTIKMLKEKIK